VEERLPTELWVKAHLRRCMAEGVPATVIRRGEHFGGSVLLKLHLIDQGCRLLTQTRDLEGRPAWLPAFSGAIVADSQADEYIARAVGRDPDLWVIEIESRVGWHPFEGTVL
jgi:hypothetical protein